MNDATLHLDDIRSDRDSLLTILIPTYNGEKTIGRCLNSVFSQIEHDRLEKSVNVFVADNCSTDATFAVTYSLSHEKSYVQLHKSDMNLGLDSNLRNALELIHSRYVKILCDDDLLLDGYLEHLLSIIESNPDTDLIVNSMTALGNPRETEKGNNASDIWKGSSDARFIQQTGGAFGQLSTLCFRTKAWIECNNSAILRDYKHHNMEFVGRVYHLSIYGCCIWDDSKLMQNDFGPKRWHTNFLDLFHVKNSHASFIFQISNLAPESLPNSAEWVTWIRKAKRSMLFQVAFDLVGLRGNGYKIKKSSASIYIPSPFKLTLFGKLLLNCIDFIPSSICKVAWRTEYILRRVLSTYFAK